MTPPPGEGKEFARVERQEIPESWKVVFGGVPGIPNMDFYEKRVADSIAERFNAHIRAHYVRKEEAEEAVSAIRVMGEEMVIAGLPGGDRAVVLANVRRLIRELVEAKKHRDAAEACSKAMSLTHSREIKRLNKDVNVWKSRIGDTVKERDRLKAALEAIAARQTEDPGPEGDCCYGNYDDAHRHGRDMGDWRCGEIAREALKGGR